MSSWLRTLFGSVTGESSIHHDDGDDHDGMTSTCLLSDIRSEYTLAARLLTDHLRAAADVGMKKRFVQCCFENGPRFIFSTYLMEESTVPINGVLQLNAYFP